MEFMIRMSYLLGLAGVLLAPALFAQTPTPTITKVNPALDALLDPNATLEKVAGDLGFLEGPLWMQEGHLLFSDLFKNTVWTLVPGGKPEAFLTKAGWTSDEPPKVTHFGPNAMVGSPALAEVRISTGHDFGAVSCKVPWFGTGNVWTVVGSAAASVAATSIAGVSAYLTSRTCIDFPSG